ncbi:hypothetical protein PybrP1_005212 [[Pythium] brassicae (nom. inval.)]|nr:hypothetical protein PybrP1_005212 [[Pythium] brassicae (nom. inval.)]
MPMGARDAAHAQPLDLSHLRLLRTDSSGSGSSSGGGGSGSGSGSEMPSEWAKRKAQFLSHFRSGTAASAEDAEPQTAVVEQPSPSAESKCHVCNVALRLLRVRHHCRNCGLAVCGVHSKNQVPLPHLGIMKEVRVCDICTRQLVQRRAGYRSPKRRQRSSSQFGRASGDEDDLLSPLAADSSSSSSRQQLCSPVHGLAPASSSSSSWSSSSASLLATPASGKNAQTQLFGHLDGIIYSCTLEEQDNTVDDILYLGTFTMGGRSFVSRRMSANVAIWKDRTFMLTSAEMLCFKASAEDSTALGEVRSAVHLTEILHVEVSDQFPRILTAIRSDGRIFRVRAKTPEQCQEIAAALKRAIRQFQDAMYRLQRGPQPEDNCVSCVTLQHESSLPEQVVVTAPALGDVFHVDMYPSSILRLYVSGPHASGVALYSSEMLAQAAAPPHHVVEAEPLGASGGANDLHVLQVTLRAEDAPPSAAAQDARRKFWALVASLVTLAAAMQTLRVTSVELLAWLAALVLVLLRFHTPISLLVTTKRLHVYKRFSVRCTNLVVGKSDEALEGGDALAPGDGDDDALDTRFLEGCNGDVEEAKRRFAKTMQWRKEHAIDSLFLRPAPHFDVMKESFLHFTHKKDKLGHPVSIEYLGAMKKSMENFLAHGVTEAEAVMHNILLQEFLWKVVDPRPYPEGVMLKIYDLKGISMADVSGDVFNYTKQLGEVVAEYNPERIYQVFIINPPSWFNFIWKLVSPLINPKTRERVHVLRGQKDIQKALLEFVDPENLPVEYGGSCRCEGGCATHSPEEAALREYMAFVNSHGADPANAAVVRERFDRLCAKFHAQLAQYDAAATMTATGFDGSHSPLPTQLEG